MLTVAISCVRTREMTMQDLVLCRWHWCAWLVNITCCAGSNCFFLFFQYENQQLQFAAGCCCAAGQKEGGWQGSCCFCCSVAGPTVQLRVPLSGILLAIMVVPCLGP